MVLRATNHHTRLHELRNFTFHGADDTSIRDLKPVVTVNVTSFTNYWAIADPSFKCQFKVNGSKWVTQVDFLLRDLFIRTNLTVWTPIETFNLTSVATGNLTVPFEITYDEHADKMRHDIKQGGRVFCRSNYNWFDGNSYFQGHKRRAEMWTDQVIMKRIPQAFVDSMTDKQPETWWSFSRVSSELADRNKK